MKGKDKFFGFGPSHCCSMLKSKALSPEAVSATSPREYTKVKRAKEQHLKGTSLYGSTAGRHRCFRGCRQRLDARFCASRPPELLSCRLRLELLVAVVASKCPRLAPLLP